MQPRQIEKQEIRENYDAVIIGAGIIGSTIAYYLSRYNLKTLVTEKNPLVADETSHGNSGLIHGGFDAHEEVEARLNVEGNAIWRNELLKDLKIPFQNVNSLVLAFNEEEMNHVHKLFQRGIQNNLDPRDLKVIGKQEVQKMEPEISKDVIGALLCTSSVLIDPVSASRAMLSVATKNKLTLQKNAKVTHIESQGNKFELTINNKRRIQTKFVVNAAGHYADHISRMANQKKFDLVARRGEYRVLSRTEHPKVKNVLFKVPTLHGKGVLVAPMLDGRVLVGPTAQENIKKEDTRLVTQEKYDLIGKIGNEIIPTLKIAKTEKTFSGSRAIYAQTNDFLIENSVQPNFINVAGIQSPGISASPAIANKVVKMLGKAKLHLEKKNSFVQKWEMVF